MSSAVQYLNEPRTRRSWFSSMTSNSTGINSSNQKSSSSSSGSSGEKDARGEDSIMGSQLLSQGLRNRHSFIASSTSQSQKVLKAQTSQSLTYSHLVSSNSNMGETSKRCSTEVHPALASASIVAPDGQPVDSVIGTLPASGSSGTHQSLWQRATCLRRSLGKTSSHHKSGRKNVKESVPETKRRCWTPPPPQQLSISGSSNGVVSASSSSGVSTTVSSSPSILSSPEPESPPPLPPPRSTSIRNVNPLNSLTTGSKSMVNLRSVVSGSRNSMTDSAVDLESHLPSERNIQEHKYKQAMQMLLNDKKRSLEVIRGNQRASITGILHPNSGSVSTAGLFFPDEAPFIESLRREFSVPEVWTSNRSVRSSGATHSSDYYTASSTASTGITASPSLSSINTPDTTTSSSNICGAGLPKVTAVESSSRIARSSRVEKPKRQHVSGFSHHFTEPSNTSSGGSSTASSSIVSSASSISVLSSSRKEEDDPIREEISSRLSRPPPPVPGSSSDHKSRHNQSPYQLNNHRDNSRLSLTSTDGSRDDSPPPPLPPKLFTAKKMMVSNNRRNPPPVDCEERREIRSSQSSTRNGFSHHQQPQMHHLHESRAATSVISSRNKKNINGVALSHFENRNDSHSHLQSSDHRSHQKEENADTASKMIYLDPSKKTKTSDTELKVIQRRALLEFYLKQKGRVTTSVPNPSTSAYNNHNDTLQKESSVPTAPRKVQLVSSGDGSHPHHQLLPREQEIREVSSLTSRDDEDEEFSLPPPPQVTEDLEEEVEEEEDDMCLPLPPPPPTAESSLPRVSSFLSSSTSTSSVSSSSPLLSPTPSDDRRGADTSDLCWRSQQVITLSQKLEALRLEELSIRKDYESNESLGNQLMKKLSTLGLTSVEMEKISNHCEEIDKVTRLLLSLSARLGVVEESLKAKSQRQSENESSSSSSSSSYSSPDPRITIPLTSAESQSIKLPQNLTEFPEIQLLLSKRSKLLSQLEEALLLKEAIDRRSQVIGDKILNKYLKDRSEINDFIEFIKLKSKLIVESKEIRDKLETSHKQLLSFKS